MKTRKTLAMVLAVAGLLLAGQSAQGAPIFVANHSFEDPAYAPGGSGAANPDWLDLGNNPGTGRTTAAQYPGGIPDGVNYAYFNQATDVLGQTLAATLQPDTTYTLTVATGWRADLTASYPNYPGYGIELWAGGTLLASDYDTSNGGTGTGPAAGTWKDVTATYTSPSIVTADALQIRLLAGAPVNGNTAIQTNYDDVRLDAATAPNNILSISDLFNTGVDGSGAALGDNVDDPHYTLHVDPSGLGDATVTDDNFPIPPWFANNAGSRWIGPADATGNKDAYGPGGDYTYRTTFTLPPDADLARVLIEGAWATDNAGLDILINGISTGQQNTVQFSSLTPFSISSGFQIGPNTLDFVVNNAGTAPSPTGLRVDNLRGTFEVGGAIPEPMTMCALGLALTSLGGYIRKRRRS